jgi:hypothetical protein
MANSLIMSTKIPTPLSIALFALCTIFCMTLDAPAQASGGDGISYNSFMPEPYVPRAEIADFANGNVGAVPASYWRVYQFLAYRALTGQPLTREETIKLNINGAYVDNTKPVLHFSYTQSDGLPTWLAARQKLLGAKAIKQVGEYRGGRRYDSYLNCAPDAFNRAAQTLGERMLQGGELAAIAWLEAQDTVFENCDGQTATVQGAAASASEASEVSKVKLPAALAPAVLARVPAPIAKLLAQDREYQTAAAYFYAGKFDEARRRFLAIAENKSSPWQPFGGYLAARCLIRDATLNFESYDESTEAKASKLAKRDALLKQARSELAALSKDFVPAQQMLGHVDARARPFERVQELGALLAKGRFDQQSTQHLTDYVRLLIATPLTELVRAKDPMTLWIALMKTSSDGDRYDVDAAQVAALTIDSLGIARKQWRSSKQDIWLLPILVNINALAGKTQLDGDERRAANDVAETSVLYQPIQYELVRTLIAERKLNDADDIVTKVLTRYQSKMSKSTSNRWLALKVATARTQEAFFQALPRQYADVNAPEPIPNELNKQSAAPISYDNDYADRLYHEFALPDLVALIKAPDFPKYIASRTTNDVIFTRAIAVGDYATADAFASEVASGRTTTQHLYDRFKRAQSTEEKQRAAALILANAPELRTEVFDGYYYNDYRGCTTKDANGNAHCSPPPLNFLPPDAIAAAKVEQEILRKWNQGEDFLIDTLLPWARQKAADPEIPKALHFFITSKRAPTKLSREAFQVLHKYYGTSEWAKKTKYYY